MKSQGIDSRVAISKLPPLDRATEAVKATARQARIQSRGGAPEKKAQGGCYQDTCSRSERQPGCSESQAEVHLSKRSSGSL